MTAKTMITMLLVTGALVACGDDTGGAGGGGSGGATATGTGGDAATGSTTTATTTTTGGTTTATTGSGEGGGNAGGAGAGGEPGVGGAGGAPGVGGGAPGVGGGGGQGGGELPLVCEDLGVCTDDDADPANDCYGCAVGGACAPEVGACEANPDCIDLNDCFNLCDPADPECGQACVQEFPGGYDDLIAAIQCIYCVTCPVSCDSGDEPVCQ